MKRFVVLLMVAILAFSAVGCMAMLDVVDGTRLSKRTTNIIG